MRQLRTPNRASGYTLIEIIIVIAVVGILATMLLPNLINVPRRAREATLKNNIHTIRSVIDQYKADKGVYPPALESLVETGYLRDVPVDPITKSRGTWILVYEQRGGQDPLPEVEEEQPPGIYDVKSAALGVDLAGTLYAEY